MNENIEKKMLSEHLPTMLDGTTGSDSFRDGHMIDHLRSMSFSVPNR